MGTLRAVFLVLGALAVSRAPAFADVPFMPLATTPVNASDAAAYGKNGIRLNGFFVQRLATEVTDYGLQACLAASPNRMIRIDAYEYGGLAIDGGPSCATPGPQEMLVPKTATIQLSAARVLALGLVVARFATTRGFATNDTDPSHYDIGVFDRPNDVVGVYLNPTSNMAVGILGCPPIGTIAVAYFVDTKTWTVKAGNMVC